MIGVHSDTAVEAPEPQAGVSDSERASDGRIVVTLPDGTILTLIGATRLVLPLAELAELGTPPPR